MRYLVVMIAVCACYPPPLMFPDGGGNVDGGGTAGMCTFSGGKTGAVPCTFTSATWTQGTNRTLIQIDSAAGAGTTVSVQFSLESTPSSATFSGGTAGTECTIDVTEGARHWGASTSMSVGACVMMLRSVRMVTDTMGTRTYELHGGFTASTEPDDAMGGTVTVQNSF